MSALRSAAPSVLLLVALATHADQHHRLESACDYSETRSGRFSSKDSLDTLSVRVSGDPCFAGVLRVVIRSSTSAVLYDYSTPVAGLTAPPATDALLHEDVRRWVEGTVSRAFSTTSDSLAPFDEISWRETALVPEEEYEAIRRRALPILSHPAGEEGWRVVVADPRDGSITPVLGGSM